MCTAVLTIEPNWYIDYGMAMSLREYLGQKNLTPEAFGGLIGVSRPTVVRYLDGTRRPSWRVLPRIIEVTKGEVTADSFVHQQPAREVA